MARKKSVGVELKDQRIPIMMTASELEAIDDWSFENRIRSRGEAIRRLCQIALGQDRRDTAMEAAAARMIELAPELLKLMPMSKNKAGDRDILTPDARRVATSFFSGAFQIFLLLQEKRGTESSLRNVDVSALADKMIESRDKIDAVAKVFNSADPMKFFKEALGALTESRVVDEEETED